jgi:uncharacterized OsmC-like protein
MRAHRERWRRWSSVQVSAADEPDAHGDGDVVPSPYDYLLIALGA